MTMVIKLRLEMEKMYFNTQNEVPCSNSLKVLARTPTHRHRHTEGRDCNYFLSTKAKGIDSKLKIIGSTSYRIKLVCDFTLV